METSKTYIFGGTFDPFHEGHVGVVRDLITLPGQTVIAPTEQNPWKKDRPTLLADRLEMISLVLEFEGLAFTKEPGNGPLVLSDYPYGYAADLVRYWRKKHGGCVVWVLGPDLLDSVDKWKDWSELNVELYAANIHAGDKRAENIRAGKARAHPAIEGFIKTRGLYRSSETC